MSLRDEVSLLMSSALSAISAGVSFFYNSPLFGVVSGVFLGAGVSIYVQSRTQKRAWKRDLALRNSDTLYGPLYNELNRNWDKIRGFSARTGYQSLDHEYWGKITSEYQYYFIRDDLREKLDRFYRLVSKYNTLSWTLLSLNNEVSVLILKEASSFWGNVLRIEYGASLQQGNTAGPLMITTCVLFNQHPRETMSSIYPGLISSHVLLVTVDSENGQKQLQLTHPDELAKFDQFFKQVVGKAQNTRLASEIRETLGGITVSGLSLKKLLLVYIQEPWSV